MDQVRVYNYARTPAQVAWDYNRGKPIAHWQFDECSGGIIHDNSGNGNHGTLQLGMSGTTATGTCASSSDSFWYNGKDGKVNAGGSFDGQGDTVNLGANTIGDLVNNSSAVTISAWIKAGTIDGSSASSNSFVEFAIESGGQPRNSFLMSIDPNTNTFQVAGRSQDGDGSQLIISKKTIAIDMWYHIIGLYDYVNDNMKIYVDGELDNSESVTFGSVYYNHNTTAYEDHIGNVYAAERYFDGLIDEVKIWNYALTDEQVKNEYNGGAVRFAE
jgi:hypothetical protein